MTEESNPEDNGCFSEWLKRCQDRHSSILCPQCRAVVQFVGRNHFLHSIEEDILESDSSLRRSDEEIALLDSYSSIKSPLQWKETKPEEARAPPDEEIVRDFPCPQCATEYAGFQCNQSTVHLQCQSCGGMMPSGPTNTTVPQHCVGCDRAFCGAYWHAMGVTGFDAYPVCSTETLKPANGTNIAGCGFRMDKKDGQPRSSDCYDKLVSFLLYWFRITLPKHTVRGKSSPLGFVWTGRKGNIVFVVGPSNFLPPEAVQREDCWYGYACRTQHHNEEHARKRNHVCRPTRGTHMS
ncbi:UNVERIFIED_CONTAM: hypothetical protein Slati_1547500 [Sesamum latifolium]|uniref:E3 ubiquitin-protein ligase CHFR cysteine rich domain-containing protein n=1 Tax=Sesamum latifolium TaxID=2727402 RepID=A0AAW2XAB4_9LAMI